MTTEINPYAAPTSEPQRPPIDLDRRGLRSRRRRVALGLSILILIACPISAVLALYDIESIVLTGLCLALAALLLMLVAIRQDLRLLEWISFSMLAMVVGTFLTIYLNSWSPPQAQSPIGIATVVFAIGIQATWVLVASVKKQTAGEAWNDAELSPGRSVPDGNETEPGQPESGEEGPGGAPQSRAWRRQAR